MLINGGRFVNMRDDPAGSRKTFPSCLDSSCSRELARKADLRCAVELLPGVSAEIYVVSSPPDVVPGLDWPDSFLKMGRNFSLIRYRRRARQVLP